MIEKEIIIDGYKVLLIIKKENYDNYVLKIVQIIGTFPFLPFNLITKIATKFLGKEHLSLVEVFKENKKIYIWYCCFNPENEKSIPSVYESDGDYIKYNDITYQYIDPKQVDFF